MYWVNKYVVDWGRVETLEDIKLILEAMNPEWDPPAVPNSIEHLVVQVPKENKEVY